MKIFWMKDKENVVNGLLGLLLVTVFALPFILATYAFAFLIRSAGTIVHTFFPTLTVPEGTLFDGFLCLCAIVGGVNAFRKKSRSQAFLSFAFIAMVISMWLAGPRSPLAGNSLMVVCIAFLLIGPLRTRLDFYLASFVIGVTFALNTGLLGAGTGARFAAGCVTVTTFTLPVWFLIQSRSGQHSEPDSDPAPLASS